MIVKKVGEIFRQPDTGQAANRGTKRSTIALQLLDFYYKTKIHTMNSSASGSIIYSFPSY